MNSGKRVLYLCIFRQIWRGVCGERPELALFVHVQANLERSLRGKRKLSETRAGVGADDRGRLQGGEKSKIRHTARELERKDPKRRNIADLAGYKKSGGEMVRKVEF